MGIESHPLFHPQHHGPPSSWIQRIHRHLIHSLQKTGLIGLCRLIRRPGSKSLFGYNSAFHDIPLIFHRLIHELTHRKKWRKVAGSMFQDAYTKIEGKKAAKILEDIGQNLSGVSNDPHALSILGCEISFYPGYQIIDITDHSQTPPGRRLALHKAGDAVVLDWTNTPIYDLNARAPLLLNAETIVEYVRFFFGHVRGPRGRFLIVEGPDDIGWRETPPPAARKAISRIAESLTVTAQNPDGSFDLRATMVVRGSLFRATIHVAARGDIEIRDQELLLDEIPVIDEILGA